MAMSSPNLDSVTRVVSDPGSNISRAAPNLDTGRSVTRLAISDLRAADSPRLNGVNEEHVRILAESDANLPPILVHRTTMRVIDGTHRIRAAQLRGDDTIEVCYFDGTEYDAFLLGIRENITHGLPLNLADRRAAASHILELSPQWSDRAIAAAAGLSGKTVGVLRRQCSNDQAVTQTRVGRDGRLRRTNPGKVRKRASHCLAEPSGSGTETMHAQSSEEIPQSNVAVGLDERARFVRGRTAANNCNATVYAVHDAIPRQLDASAADNTHGSALRSYQQSAVPGVDSVSRKAEEGNGYAIMISQLWRDPTLRLSESGRTLLRMLSLHSLDHQEWDTLIANIPSHCAPRIADLARQCADKWRSLAEHLYEG
jgi:hypothetical protein